MIIPGVFRWVWGVGGSPRSYRGVWGLGRDSEGFGGGGGKGGTGRAAPPHSSAVLRVWGAEGFWVSVGEGERREASEFPEPNIPKYPQIF